MSEVRNDAAFQMLFNEALEALDPKLYDSKYPGLRARELVPTLDGGSGVNAAHTQYTYELVDGTGEAKIVGSRSTDLPQADLDISRFSTPIVQLGNAYSFDRSEVRALTEGRGMDVVLARLEQARKVMERKLDALIALGDTNAGLEGAVNNSAVTAASVTTGTWGGATVDQIIADINEQINLVATGTAETHQATDIWLPPSAMRDLRAARITDTSMSLMDYIEATFSEINFDTWNRLESAGAGATRRMVTLQRDPEVLAAIVPQEFTRLEPIYKGFFWEVPCEARCAGTVVRYPLAMRYGDGL